VRLMQPAAHTTSRNFLAVSTGALEVLLKYLRRIINARLLTFTRVEVWVRVGVRDWVGVWVGVGIIVGVGVRVGIDRKSECY